jgi:cyclopropane-fatty-acyl-phospholipid synthase
MAEYFQDITAWLIFTTFRVYCYFFEIYITCFLPSVKKAIDEIFAKRRIKVGGSAPQDIIVLDEKKFYTKLVIERNLGFLEGYMEGAWTTRDLKLCLNTFMPKVRWNALKSNTKAFTHPLNPWIKALNLQTKTKAFEVGVKHYDIGMIFYILYK